MKKTISIFILTFSLILIFSSCVKKEKEEDTETQSATENALATNIDNDMNNIADEAGRTKNVSSFRTTDNTAILNSCVTLHFDTLLTTNADSITVDFGNSNCMGNDGRLRRGTLLIIYNGKYKDSLTTITISPINYYVNDNKVSGTKTIKNLGHTTSGHLVYTINSNISITKADNTGTIQWSGLHQREWHAGENTLVWNDDRYSISGSASGVNANGRSFTSIINPAKPLIRDMAIGCRKHFVSGELQHTPQGKPTRYIDYGNGTCDDKATITINGKAYTVILP